jgi:hypothetical protein
MRREPERQLAVWRVQEAQTYLGQIGSDKHVLERYEGQGSPQPQRACGGLTIWFG